MHQNSIASPSIRAALLAMSGLLLAVLSGCSSTVHRAPVEDRPVSQSRPAPVAAGPVAPASAASAPEAPKQGAENAGKPGYYTVKPGDALIRIAMDYGQNYRDIARWNSIDNPDRIEVGQVLRVIPPGAVPDAPGVTTRPVTTAKVERRPLEGKASNGKPDPAAPAASAASAAATPSQAVASNPEEDFVWAWPAFGPVVGGFDEPRNKGIDIGGKAGDPIYASADGQVVYAGAGGVRGYGNMIVIKHGTNYLTAYAHNQSLLVKEQQFVRKGQRIAEMGNTEADQVKLHFEIRKQGKPLDPAKLLPSR
ncbi:peptidoglycan DD-metalloendopeptidase family protein [Pelomonas sp. SE-A7]|uniref:peptidoglycan DD-metalloendopeptidase family protein n=1 Tax=Pelomonas sp. SE-A7 TaxID=3054953 RepID=UPI00259C7C7C|nr:peptidoglycan DD-metalloendopeptidase family protein [Pelomonas sp. SE-A7]MDM4764815.1 peptidoglycan DD-metalloendopeptidase family protein [Pelomonas sp. SE-A7]